MKAKKLYRIAAVLFVLFTVGHTFGFLSFKASSAAGAAVRTEMDRVPVGDGVTWGGFFVAFGLDISAYMAFSALLAWGLGSLSDRPSAGFGLIAWGFAALQLATLVLSLVYIGVEPSVFSAVAALLLGWAALSSARNANQS
jgi:hypothetical protein